MGGGLVLVLLATRFVGVHDVPPDYVYRARTSTRPPHLPYPSPCPYRTAQIHYRSEVCFYRSRVGAGLAPALVTRRNIHMLLAGLRGFITGAGTGIGRAIALEMVREGADLAITDIDLTSAQKVVGE